MGGLCQSFPAMVLWPQLLFCPCLSVHRGPTCSAVPAVPSLLQLPPRFPSQALLQ